MNKEQWQIATDVIQSWHRRLDDNRGERAALRRCRKVADLYACPAGFELIDQLKRRGIPTEGLTEKWLKVAGVLTHFRKDTPRAVGKDMANRENHIVVRKFRFYRFMKSDDEQIFKMMIRIASIMKRRINFQDCARLIFEWDRDYTRKQIAEDYYLNLPKN